MRTTGLARLITDPDLRTTTTGRTVCQMRVMMLERGKSTGLIDLVAWGTLAEHCQRYLLKNREVHVDGVIRMREWTDSDERRRSSYAITADSIDFLSGPRREADEHPVPDSDTASYVPAEDIPF